MIKASAALASALRSIQKDTLAKIKTEGRACLLVSRLHAIARNKARTDDEQEHLSMCRKCQIRLAQLRELSDSQSEQPNIDSPLRGVIIRIVADQEELLVAQRLWTHLSCSQPEY